MKYSFGTGSFSARLLIGFVVLIVLTTLSAGVPAYWLTRIQLERQARLQVENARSAAQSLLLAEQDRLESQLILFSERPTLETLIAGNSLNELDDYILDFRVQSGLDLLLVCTTEDELLAGDLAEPGCLAGENQGYSILGGGPYVFARQPIAGDETGDLIGKAVGGILLSDSFLQRLAAATGTDHSILNPGGKRLLSSFAEPGSSASLPRGAWPNAYPESTLTIGGDVYYATYMKLVDEAGWTRLVSEVALPVDDLIATERQAFLVLAGSTATVAILGALFSIWFVRQVGAPLQRLTTAAEKISHGDLAAPIPVFSSPEEVRTLAAALQRSQASMLEALQEKSEVGERLNALLQSVAEGVVTYDEEGLVTFWSEGAHHLLGWSPLEALDRHVDRLFPLQENDSGLFLDQAPQIGQRKQLGVLTRTGRPIVLALTSSRLIPPGGDTVQVALVFRDVTEEAALRRLRSYFLANISHEFRTPLSTLIASMEYLLDEQADLTPAEVRLLVRPTHVSLLSLQTLVDNLLESSSIEAGQFTLRTHKFDFREAVSNAAAIAAPLLERRSQELSIAAPDQLPQIEGDSARLTQVLSNLIINASKYGPIGGPIGLRLLPFANTLRVEVTDSGPGIPPDERGNLFRSFVRLDSGDKEQYGIGLGLFVVKTVVEAHGGQVGVDDRPGGGSRFWFEIPVMQGAEVK